MIEITEEEVPATVTSVVIDNSVDAFCAFCKGLYGKTGWWPLSVWPNISKEISFEDFKEKVRLQVSANMINVKAVQIKFARIRLEE